MVATNIRVAIRVDASVEIGTGHVMRCLTLAKEFQDRDIDVYFICRDLKGNLASLIQGKNFRCKLLNDAIDNLLIDENKPLHARWLGVSWEQDADETGQILCDEKVDWLIVDHYGLDSRWHRQVRKCVDRLLVIDDLADRELDCDILLDQNYYMNPDQRYKNLVSDKCRCLLSPRYALLREEFTQQLQIKKCRMRNKIKRLFVFMGGADLTNETEKILMALDKVENFQFDVDLVVSSVNPRADNIKKMCNDRGYCNYFIDIENIGELMSEADLAIGAGGSTTLERCYVGVPSLVIVVAENQKETTAALDMVGALQCLGWHSAINSDVIYRSLKKYINDPKKLEEMCINARKVIGGNDFCGVNGVVSEILRTL